MKGWQDQKHKDTKSVLETRLWEKPHWRRSCASMLEASGSPGSWSHGARAGWRGGVGSPGSSAERQSCVCLAWPGSCILLLISRHTARRGRTETAKTAKNTYSRVAGSSSPAGGMGELGLTRGRGCTCLGACRASGRWRPPGRPLLPHYARWGPR